MLSPPPDISWPGEVAPKAHADRVNMAAKTRSTWGTSPMIRPWHDFRRKGRSFQPASSQRQLKQNGARDRCTRNGPCDGAGNLEPESPRDGREACQ